MTTPATTQPPPAADSAAPDGAVPRSSGGYDPAFFETLDRVEDRHFWFRARGRVIGRIARSVARRFGPGYRVLEIGCGNGGVLRVLRESCPGGRVMGMDLFAEGLSRAARRSGVPLVQGDVRRPPFDTSAAPFQIVGMFDVIEHLEDDVAVLRDVRRLLSPDGALLVTVPAHPSLWSYFDEASHHCRRYTTALLGERLREAGFRVEFLSQFMAPLFPLMWAGRRAAALKARLRRGKAGGDSAANGDGRPDVYEMSSAELRVVPVVNALLSGVLSLESHLLARHWPLPLGTSLLAVARRDDCRDPGPSDPA